MSEDLPEEEQSGIPDEVSESLSDVDKVQQEYMQKCAEHGQLSYQIWLHEEEIYKMNKKKETLFRYMKKLNNKAHELKQQEQPK